MAHLVRPYGDPQYWASRYSKSSTPFEWLQSYEGVAELIEEELMNKAGKLVVAGTGTSSLAKDINKLGEYTDVVGIDTCRGLIDSLNGASGGLPAGLSYQQGRVQDMEELFGAGAVEYIVDKACLDAVLCADGSTREAYMYMKAIKGVLKPGGKALIISYNPPAQIEEHFREEFGFSVTNGKLIRPTVAGVAHKPDQDPYHYWYLLVT